jgi:hypothetical protein
MLRTRSILICTAVLLALLSVNPVAAGGGGSTFDFNRRSFAPGQTVVGSTQFSDGIEEQGQVADGPYFAYLVRGETFIEPPHLPHDAIRLGRVKMHRFDSGIWEASIRFVVPDLPPGTYTVSLCNDPCRNAFVGDLMGAWISVVATAEQAKFRNLEARIEERVMQQTWDATAGFQEQIDALRERPPSTSVGTDLRLTTIEDQVERLNAQVRDLEKPADEGLVAWLWMAGWIVAAGLTIAWRATVVRRRRSTKIPRQSESPLSDEVVWNEVPAPVHDERVWQPDRTRTPGELVSR